MKKKIIAIILIISILVTSLLCFTFNKGSNSDLSVDAEEKYDYTILEIYKDKTAQEMGYLVKDSEPIDLKSEKITSLLQKYVQDNLEPNESMILDTLLQMNSISFESLASTTYYVEQQENGILCSDDCFNVDKKGRTLQRGYFEKNRKSISSEELYYKPIYLSEDIKASLKKENNKYSINGVLYDSALIDNLVFEAGVSNVIYAFEELTKTELDNLYGSSNSDDKDTETIDTTEIVEYSEELDETIPHGDTATIDNIWVFVPATKGNTYSFDRVTKTYTVLKEKTTDTITKWISLSNKGNLPYDTEKYVLGTRNVYEYVDMEVVDESDNKLGTYLDNVNLVNNEYFNKNILKDAKISVRAKSMSDVTVEDLADVDLVYFNDKVDTKYSKLFNYVNTTSDSVISYDISSEVANEIFLKVANQDKQDRYNFTVILNSKVDITSDKLSNYERLNLALTMGYPTVIKKLLDLDSNNKEIKNYINTFKNYNELQMKCNDLYNNLNGDTTDYTKIGIDNYSLDTNFIVEHNVLYFDSALNILENLNVFCIDNTKTDNLKYSISELCDYVVTDYLKTGNKENHISNIYVNQNIVSDIKQLEKNDTDENLQVIKSKIDTKKLQMISQFSLQQALDYLIFNQKTTSIQKNILNILELQPCKSYLSDSFWQLRALGIDPYYKGTVKVTRMITKEFQGYRTNLFRDFDIVYLGANIDRLATKRTENIEKYFTYTDSLTIPLSAFGISTCEQIKQDKNSHSSFLVYVDKDDVSYIQKDTSTTKCKRLSDNKELELKNLNIVGSANVNLDKTNKQVTITKISGNGYFSFDLTVKESSNSTVRININSLQMANGLTDDQIDVFAYDYANMTETTIVNLSRYFDSFIDNVKYLIGFKENDFVDIGVQDLDLNIISKRAKLDKVITIPIQIKQNSDLADLTVTKTIKLYLLPSSTHNIIKTVYNDNNMNGMIYTHMGDKIQVASNFNNNTLNYKGITWRPDEGSCLRLSGNDFTKVNYEEMLQFCKTGKLIMLSNNFFNSLYDLDDSNFDTSSYIYKLATKKDISIYNEDAVINFDYSLLDESYFDLDIIDLPLVYRDTSDTDKCKFDNSNKIIKFDKATYPYYKTDGGKLEYTYDELGIKDSSERDTAFYLDDKTLNITFRINQSGDYNKDYTIQFYADSISDGAFTDKEIIKGITIFDSHNRRVRSTMLKPNTEYRLNFTGGKDLVGIVHWQIRVFRNTNETLCQTYDNYVALNRQEDEVLTILQIMPKSGCTYNMQSNATFNEYLAKVPNFKVVIFTIGENDLDVTFRNKSGATSTKKIQGLKLTNSKPNHVSLTTCQMFYEAAGLTYDKDKGMDIIDFDMLVMGYADWKGYIDDPNLVAEIERFINMDKAVLFTHDNNYLGNNKDNLNSNPLGLVYITKYFRSVMGQDRYGIMYHNDNVDVTTVGTKNENTYWLDLGLNTSLSNLDKFISEMKEKGFDYAKINGNNEYTGIEGISDMSIIRMMAFKNNTYLSYSPSKVYNNKDISNLSSQTNSLSTKVSSLNRGQITNYPFYISDTISVKTTHSQYYQLNLDDKNLSVWYTLVTSKQATEGMDYFYDKWYDEVGKDGRNNFYIYTKDNITYSGVGHSTGMTPEECKLFINTLILAYRTTIDTPKLTILNEYADTADPHNSYVYLDYDVTDPSTPLEEDMRNNQFKLIFQLNDSNIAIDAHNYMTIKITMGEEEFDYTFDKNDINIFNLDTDERVKTSEVTVEGETIEAACLDSTNYFYTLIDIDALKKEYGKKFGDSYDIPMNVTLYTVAENNAVQIDTYNIDLVQRGLFNIK